MQGITEIDRVVIPAGYGSGLVDQKYVFYNVAPGTYSIVVTKDTHTEFTIESVVMVEDAVNLERDLRVSVKPITLRCGDLTGSGRINMDDLMILLTDFMNPSYLAVNSMTDLDGDGLINMKDLMILLNPNHFMQGRDIIP
jgi:uncharacterized protein (DUF2141 family)